MKYKLSDVHIFKHLKK